MNQSKPPPRPPKAAPGHSWRTYRLFGLTLRSDLPFANRLAPGRGAVDLIFTRIARPPVASDWDGLRPSYASPDVGERGESLGYLYRLDACDVLRFTKVMDFYLWPERIWCHLLDAAYQFQIEVHLLGPVLSYWLERQGIAVLHAAAVVVGGQAVAFLSGKHRGKTALAGALMQAGLPLLTDDILPVERRPGALLGRPGYPSMRMWPPEAEHFLGHYKDLALIDPQLSKRRVPVGADSFGSFCAEPQPLGRIYVLDRLRPEQATHTQITPVSPRDAMVELLRHSFTPRLVEAIGLQGRRLELFSHVAQDVPMRRLSFPSGYRYLPDVCEAILADVRAG